MKIHSSFWYQLLKAVDKHAGLLRASAADVGNDHRLGAHEAPPAIISVYLGEQLEHVKAPKLAKLLPEVLLRINAEITPLSLDTEVGLFIHLACCIDRLVVKEASANNPRKKAILSKYENEYLQLLKLFKPIEKAFHIILNDDEMANILTIIYQI